MACQDLLVLGRQQQLQLSNQIFLSWQLQCTEDIYCKQDILECTVPGQYTRALLSITFIPSLGNGPADGRCGTACRTWRALL